MISLCNIFWNEVLCIHNGKLCRATMQICRNLSVYIMVSFVPQQSKYVYIYLFRSYHHCNHQHSRKCIHSLHQCKYQHSDMGCWHTRRCLQNTNKCDQYLIKLFTKYYTHRVSSNTIQLTLFHIFQLRTYVHNLKL